jgi:hypothetical protein
MCENCGSSLAYAGGVFLFNLSAAKRKKSGGTLAQGRLPWGRVQRTEPRRGS